MNELFRDAETAIELGFCVVGVASAIAAATKTPNDDQFLAKLYRLLDILALNVGYAKDRSVSPREDEVEQAGL